MRTKTLVAAAFFAAGIATSMAQAVYSVNMVGYINKTLTPGLQMVANQLNASPNNQVQNVFGSPAGNALSISKFNGVGYDGASYDEDGWINGTMTLNPGEGAFVDNVGPELTVTFVGEVQLVSSVQLISGLKIYSTALPQEGPIDTMDFPPAGADFITISQWNGGGYDSSSYTVEDGWIPGVPNIAIAESFFMDNAGPVVNWARSFSVGP